MKQALAVLAIAVAALPTAAAAQLTAPLLQPIAGTRLEISAVGEVNRVPDIAVITAGVVTRALTATGAIQENVTRMERVRAALRRTGIAERDIQTSSINLNPEYRYQENRAPELVGYTASNNLQVRFRDIRSTGRILDALVAEGANQINGPTLMIDEPEGALNEARVKALANGQARAQLYARALNKRVVRLLSVSEGGGNYPVPPPMPMMARAERSADTSIEPGEQKVEVTLAMVFELQ